MIDSLPVFSWMDFFVSLGLLGFIWLLFRLAVRFLDWIPMSYRWNQWWKEFLRFGLILMEPITFVLLTVLLVLISPWVYGSLLLAIIIIGFNHLKNYFTGLLLRLNNTIRPHVTIAANNRKGIVERVGRSALYVQSEAGFERIPYHRLEQRGFVITESNVGGRLRNFYLDIKDYESPLVRQQLIDLLTICPFVDWKYAPKVWSDVSMDCLQVSVFLKEDTFSPYLLSLLAERGFVCINNV